MKKTIAFAAASLLALMPGFASAQIVNPLGTENVAQIVATILGYITKVGAVVAVIAFIWVGFKFVSARGNEKELIDARKMFFWTVIGVAILLGAQLLAALVVGTVKSI